MNDMKQALQASATAARTALQGIEDAIKAWDSLPENNVFESLEAAAALEDTLRDLAFRDCEGAGNCGAPIYERGFMVDGVRYIGTLTVEYNRHDKTYYYIDGATFTYRAV